MRTFNFMKRQAVTLAAVLSVVTMGTGFVACSDNDDEKTPVQEIPAGIIGTWHCEYNAAGTADSDHDLQPWSLYGTDDPFVGKTIQMPDTTMLPSDNTTMTFLEADVYEPTLQVNYTIVNDVYVFREDGTGHWRRFFSGEEDPIPVIVWGENGTGDFNYTVFNDGTVNITLKNDLGQQYDRSWTVNYSNDHVTTTGAQGENITLDLATEDDADSYDIWAEMLSEDQWGGSASAPTSNEKALLAEVNLARTNPTKYANTRLTALLKTFKSDGYTQVIEKRSIMQYNGKAEVQSAIAAMKKMKPRKALKWHSGLWKAAKSHCKDLGPKGMFSHSSSNGEACATRIKRIAGKSYSGECISSGFGEARNVVTQLIVDYGYMGTKPHRDIIMSTNYTLMGGAIGQHSIYKYMSTLDFAK